jgi:hypothetical protein
MAVTSVVNDAPQGASFISAKTYRQEAGGFNLHDGQ